MLAEPPCSPRPLHWSAARTRRSVFPKTGRFAAEALLFTQALVVWRPFLVVLVSEDDESVGAARVLCNQGVTVCLGLSTSLVRRH